MSDHPVCPEQQSLQRSFDDAISVWEEDRSGVRPINQAKLAPEESARLRAQALLARNTAADALYVHLRTCPTCSHAKR